MMKTGADLKAWLDSTANLYPERPQGSQNAGNLYDAVAQEVARVAPGSKFARDIHDGHRLCHDYGFDDLDFISLALALEARLNLPVALDLTRCGYVHHVVYLASMACPIEAPLSGGFGS